MARHRPRRDHACATHTRELVESLRPLAPVEPAEDAAVRPAELVGWIDVDAETEPEIDGHGWRVDLADEVGILVDPDEDDVATALAEQAGVRSVVQLDREVLVLSAPALCADGVRAAVVQAVAAANASAHRRSPTGRRGSTGPGHPHDTPPGTAATPAADTEDDLAARLVTGNARTRGGRVQVWVDQDGILVLPAGTLPHGPPDTSDNPRFQRAVLGPTEAAGLARRHSGRWIPYAALDGLELRRPGALRRRWSATITETGGDPVSFTWRGTRPHGMLLWAYVVARCGLDRVDGTP